MPTIEQSAEETMPGQVAASINPAYGELEEYLSLLARAEDYKNAHPRVLDLIATCQNTPHDLLISPILVPRHG